MSASSPLSASLGAPVPSVHRLALLAAAAAAASFISMDSTIKLISPRYDAFQLSFFRFASGAVFAVLLWAWARTPLPCGSAWRMHGLRSVLLLVSLVTYFHGLTVLPLAQAVAISYLAPIFTSVLAMLLLRERPSRWIWGALALGFAGVLASVWPELRHGWDDTDPRRLVGVGSLLLSALAFSGVLVLARHQAQRDSLWTILLVQNLLPAALLALPAALTWKPLHLPDLGPIALAGLFATIGLLAITYAFTHLEASRVAPVEYTGFVWAGALGFLLFGEIPAPTTWVAAGLIVSGCLLLVRR